MIAIKRATTLTGFKYIEQLADVIWREHYITIIGKPQVDYMLEKFQSAEVVFEQIELGFEYYIINFDNKPVGYISIKKEKKALFLSKVYVLSAYRGKKIGKTAMLFIEESAKTYQLKKIRLTVNKHNTNSIRVYKKLGFVNIGAVVIDIGNGFVMDDYEMVKCV